MTDERWRRPFGAIPPQATGPDERPAVEDVLPSSREPAPATDPAAGPLWTVGAVAAEVGLAAPTLRSWDRRYGVGPTARTEGRHRRYTAADVRRVRLMSLFTATGVTARSAAATVEGLTDQQVEERLGLSASARGGAGSAHSGTDLGGPADTWGLVDAICSAAHAMDGPMLSAHFRQALRSDDIVTVWESVLAPALRRIGQLWSAGEMGIEGEHLASEALGAELRAMTRGQRSHTGPAQVLLATADEDQHHLPLLALEAALAHRGVGSRMLGARVPSDTVLAAADSAHLPVVFLWASMPRRADEPLWDQLSRHEGTLTVVVGGPGWPVPLRSPSTPGLTVVRVADFATAADALEHAATAA